MHSKEHHTVIHSATLRPEDWARFVQVDPFPGQWTRLGLLDDDLRALEICIMTAPKVGAVIPGTNGLRKVRFVTSNLGRGKSGAYRVFYVYFPSYGTVVLMAIIAKSQKADLTKADRNAFAKVIERLGRLLDQGVIK